MQFYSRRHNIPAEAIVLQCEGRILDLSDTPDSVGLMDLATIGLVFLDVVLAHICFEINVVCASCGNGLLRAVQASA